jgi:thymidylate kinase
METKLLVLEGLDGTGKTTIASYLIKNFSNGDFPIHYIYFQKRQSLDMTYDYFLDLYEVIKRLNGLVIMDRSIISTFAYSLIGTSAEVRRFEFYREFDPLIIYLSKIYDQSKLPDHDQLNFIEERYNRALDFLQYYLNFPIIRTTAEVFMQKIKTIKDLQFLIKLNVFP